MGLRNHSIQISLILAFVFTGPFESFGQSTEQQESLEVEIRWKHGEKYRYEIVKARRKYEADNLSLNTQSRTPLAIEVLEKTSEGYVLGWTMGETTFDAPEIAANPLAKQMGNLLKGFTILLEIDSNGVITGVQNWKELQEKSDSAVNTLTGALQKSGLPEQLITNIASQVRSVLSTKEQIEQLCTKEPQMFLLVLGRRYPLSEPFEYEDQLANPYGGEPFPSRGVFSVNEFSDETNLATITWQQSIDADESRRIMENTLKELAVRMGRPVPDGELLKTLAIGDEAEFLLDVASGWPVRLNHTRTVDSGENSQEDSLTIERADAQGGPYR